eukprot:m.951350 g.951350  ORF g.951350 m.951350 type:complete len:199 (+) comp23866_c0_seq5:2319-2915(+)
MCLLCCRVVFVSSDTTSSIEVHGGYDKENIGVATVGRCREPINAWLPLYVCEAHWKRVQYFVQPTLGFFCCMDPLAFDDKQYYVLLHVLGTMAMRVQEASFGERELKLFLSYRRTCRAILSSTGYMEKCAHVPVMDFVNEPSKRFKDVVTTLTALIGGFLVADQEIATAAADKGWCFRKVLTLGRPLQLFLRVLLCVR